MHALVHFTPRESDGKRRNQSAVKILALIAKFLFTFADLKVTLFLRGLCDLFMDSILQNEYLIYST